MFDQELNDEKSEKKLHSDEAEPHSHSVRNVALSTIIFCFLLVFVPLFAFAGCQKTPVSFDKGASNTSGIENASGDAVGEEETASNPVFPALQSSPFTKIAGSQNLVYDKATHVVYYKFAGVYSGYLAPFISENGKYCTYDEETDLIEEIE